ncbi:uncharacterized protein BJX67DRAFT_377227 [Aspergillus lucknowensis]|uniref:Uncharacterized protein n=1 Tax=Aspergillus lucknowensis TaxID=176173 RepID=A0ABR4M4D1_9EURO
MSDMEVDSLPPEGVEQQQQQQQKLPPYQFGDQPKRLRLPPEILNLINEYIVGGRPDKPHYFGSVPAYICLVNKLWNRIFTPILYTQFGFHGDINKVWSLWAFLRTISQRPDLAAHVQELTLTTWDIYEPFEPHNMRRAFNFIWRYSDLFQNLGPTHTHLGDHYNRNRSAADQAWDWFRQVCLTQAGTIRAKWKSSMKSWHANALYEYHRNWIQRLLPAMELDAPTEDIPLDDIVRSADRKLYGGVMEFGYQTPLVALIIVACPNLARLSFDVWGPGQDPFFERILAYATKRRPAPRATFQGNGNGSLPMSKLEVLNIAGRHELPLGNSPMRRGWADISEFRNYYALPRVRDLVVLNGFMSAPLPDPPTGADAGADAASSIEHLTLYGDWTRAELPSLFKYTTNLRQLSLKMHFDHASTLTERGLTDGPARWAWVWKMLYHVKSQLEYLDLYQGQLWFDNDDEPVFDNRTFDDENKPDAEVQPFCPPLAEFTALRHMNITPLGLHGYKCDHVEGQKFGNHLPPNLQSLGLYVDRDWIPHYIPCIEAELASIAVTGSRPGEGKLGAIVYERRGDLPRARMQEVAEGAGMFYSEHAVRYLYYGGINTLWGLMNNPDQRATREDLFRSSDQARVTPLGMVLYDNKGRLKERRDLR